MAFAGLKKQLNKANQVSWECLSLVGLIPFFSPTSALSSFIGILNFDHGFCWAQETAEQSKPGKLGMFVTRRPDSILLSYLSTFVFHRHLKLRPWLLLGSRNS